MNIFFQRKQFNLQLCLEKIKQKKRSAKVRGNVCLGLQMGTSSEFMVLVSRTRVRPSPSDPQDSEVTVPSFLLTRPLEAKVESHQQHHLVAKPLVPTLSTPLHTRPSVGCRDRALSTLRFGQEADTSPLKLPHKSWKYIEQRVPFPVHASRRSYQAFILSQALREGNAANHFSE